jgi:hypothetical protein
MIAIAALVKVRFPPPLVHFASKILINPVADSKIDPVGEQGKPYVKLAETAVEEADAYLKTGKTDKPEKQTYDYILVNSDSSRNYRNFDVVQ